jgi:hypothetical protein
MNKEEYDKIKKLKDIFDRIRVSFLFTFKDEIKEIDEIFSDFENDYYKSQVIENWNIQKKLDEENLNYEANSNEK